MPSESPLGVVYKDWYIEVDFLLGVEALGVELLLLLLESAFLEGVEFLLLGAQPVGGGGILDGDEVPLVGVDSLVVDFAVELPHGLGEVLGVGLGGHFGLVYLLVDGEEGALGAVALELEVVHGTVDVLEADDFVLRDDLDLGGGGWMVTLSLIWRETALEALSFSSCLTWSGISSCLRWWGCAMNLLILK